MRPAVLALLAWIGAGCGPEGCARKPPPVLFDAGGGTARDAGGGGNTPGGGNATGDSGDADGGRPLAVVSNAVPGDGSSITLDGVTARAPDGERFARYLALDGDGDGDRDAVVTRLRPDNTVAGFAYLRRDANALAVLTPQGGDPPDPRCTGAQLHSVSPRSVIVTYECGPSNEPGARQYTAAENLVVGLGRDAQVRMRVSLFGPWEAGSTLELTVDAVDRDNDGRDDVVITMGARRTAEPAENTARAQVLMFDRQGAYVRDVSEPEASFAQLAAAARGMATRRRGLDGAALVERVVRLERALCREAGAPRLRFGADTGVSCAGSEALPSAGEAAARALAAAGELPAAWELTRREATGGQVAATSPRVVADLRRQTPMERGVVARAGPFIGEAIGTTSVVHATALAFDPPGAPLAIMVRGPSAARVDLSTLQKADAEPGSTLDLAPRSPDGAFVLQGFYVTCDGIVAAFCPSSSPECSTPAPRADAIPPGAVLGSVSDFLSQERAAACVRDPGMVGPARALDVRALGWGSDGMLVEHAGRLVRVAPNRTTPVLIAPGAPLGTGFPAGSSVTANGEFAVVAGVDGLLVRDRTGHWKMWSAPNLVGRYRQLTDLALSADGRALAALYSGQLWVLDHGAPTGTSAGPTFEPGAGPPDGH